MRSREVIAITSKPRLPPINSTFKDDGNRGRISSYFDSQASPQYNPVGLTTTQQSGTEGVEGIVQGTSEVQL